MNLIKSDKIRNFSVSNNGKNFAQTGIDRLDINNKKKDNIFRIGKRILQFIKVQLGYDISDIKFIAVKKGLFGKIHILNTSIYDI